MIQMKEEIFSLVRENYKLRVKAVETQGEAKVKDLLAKIEDKDRSIRKRENDLRDEKRKEASGGWEKGEKQRVLEDFKYLKTLYEKDKKLMEGLLDESQRKLRSANAIVQSLESIHHQPPFPPTPEVTLLGGHSPYQKRASIVNPLMDRSAFESPPGGSAMFHPTKHRHSIATFSPLIHSYQDKLQGSLSVSSSHENLGSLALGSSGGLSDHHLHHLGTSNGLGSSNGAGAGAGNGCGSASASASASTSNHQSDMMDLVDMLTAENSKLRRMSGIISPY